jgi:hypothetical protein
VGEIAPSLGSEAHQGKLGTLTWTGGDPLSPSSWTKRSTPVFQRTGVSIAGPSGDS